MGDRILWAVEMGRSGLDDQKMRRLQREEGVCVRKGHILPSYHFTFHPERHEQHQCWEKSLDLVQDPAPLHISACCHPEPQSPDQSMGVSILASFLRTFFFISQVLFVAIILVYQCSQTRMGHCF